MRGRILAQALATTAVALFVVAPAGAAQWIGIPPSEPLSAPGVVTNQPVVAVNASGAEIVAWIAGTSVVATVRAPGGGAFTAPATINSPGATSSVTSVPSVAIDTAGNTLVVWSENDGAGNYSVQFAGGTPGQAPAGGAAISGSTSTAVKIGSQAMFFTDGTALVAWASYGGSLEYARRAPGGSFGGASPFPGAGSVQDLGVAPDVGDNALVSWVEYASASRTTTLKLAGLSAGGVATGAQTIDTVESEHNTVCEEFFSCVTRSLGAPRLAGDAAGDAVIAYESTNSSGLGGLFTTTTVKAAYRAAGSGFQAIATAFTPSLTLFLSGGVSLADAVLPDGTALVAWDEGGVLAPSSGIQYAERGRSTPFQAASQTLASKTASDNYYQPSIAAVGDTGLVAFVHNKEILAQPVGGGGPQGLPTIISAADRTVNTPRLAGDGAGDAVAVWGRYDASSNQLVETAAYDTGPRLSGLAVPATGLTGAALPFAVTASDPLSPVSVAWTFGDGAKATGASVSHAYAAPGAQTASVVATNAAGMASATLSGVTQVSLASVGGGGGKLKTSLKIPKQRLRDVLRKGLAVTVGCSGPCKLQVTLQVSAGVAKALGLAARAAAEFEAALAARRPHHRKPRPATVGRLGVSFTAAGSKTVHVKLTKTAKRHIRHVHRLTLSVIESASGPGAPRALTRQITLR